MVFVKNGFMKIFVMFQTRYMSPVVPSGNGDVFKVVVTGHAKNGGITWVMVRD